MNPLPLSHTEARLQQEFVRICEAAGQRAPLSGLKIIPPLAVWEAQYFLLGLEEDLFVFDEQGEIQSGLIPPPGDENTRQKSCPIFSADRPPRLLRENICQLATASFLVLERGWLKRHIALEPSRPEHRSTVHGIDLLVKATGDAIDIWVEVKRNTAELEKLITDLRACSRRGPHAHQDCGFPQNHPRYEFCLFSRPAYLWAVAPDANLCFEVKCDSGAIQLAQLPSLPPRSLIERA